MPRSYCGGRAQVVEERVAAGGTRLETAATNVHPVDNSCRPSRAATTLPTWLGSTSSGAPTTATTSAARPISSSGSGNTRTVRVPSTPSDGSLLSSRSHTRRRHPRRHLVSRSRSRAGGGRNARRSSAASSTSCRVWRADADRAGVREVTEASRRACGAPQPPRRRSTQVVEERVAAGGTRLETPATTHDPDAPRSRYAVCATASAAPTASTSSRRAPTVRSTYAS